jgi:acetyltransferase-like isoleucine patch superfamily enzyme
MKSKRWWIVFRYLHSPVIAMQNVMGSARVSKMQPKDHALARIYNRLRIARLNSTHGITIGNPAYLSSSARLQLKSDGRHFGGKIIIGDDVTISDGVIIATYGGTVAIGSRAYVGPYCVLYGHGGLRIGSNTMIGAHTVIVPANHSFNRTDIPLNLQPTRTQGITIADDVWIGARCCILDGVNIGRGAVIGAGAVVTKDIDAYSVAFGVPALVMRSRSNAEVTRPIAARDARVTSAS